MKFIGFEREDEAVAWAKKRIGIDGPTGFARAMSAVDDCGNFVLVIVMSNFSSRNIDVHLATQPNGQGLVPKEGLHMFNVVFSYIFNDLNATRVTGLGRAKNKVARRFIEHLGFKLEGIMREAFEDDDLCVYGFLKKDFIGHRWYHGR
jgi:RimJ/RimL family protein N-acetyltransferase